MQLNYVYFAGRACVQCSLSVCLYLIVFLNVGSNQLQQCCCAFSLDQKEHISLNSTVAHSVLRAADVHVLHYNANF